MLELLLCQPIQVIPSCLDVGALLFTSSPSSKCARNIAVSICKYIIPVDFMTLYSCVIPIDTLIIIHDMTLYIFLFVWQLQRRCSGLKLPWRVWKWKRVMMVDMMELWLRKKLQVEAELWSMALEKVAGGGDMKAGRFLLQTET